MKVTYACTAPGTPSPPPLICAATPHPPAVCCPRHPQPAVFCPDTPCAVYCPSAPNLLCAAPTPTCCVPPQPPTCCVLPQHPPAVYCLPPPTCYVLPPTPHLLCTAPARHPRVPREGCSAAPCTSHRGCRPGGCSRGTPWQSEPAAAGRGGTSGTRRAPVHCQPSSTAGMLSLLVLVDCYTNERQNVQFGIGGAAAAGTAGVASSQLCRARRAVHGMWCMFSSQLQTTTPTNLRA